MGRLSERLRKEGITNAALQVARGIGWYSGFLEETLVEVRAVKEAVELYLAADS